MNNDMNGLIVVDKPRGMTSHDVVLRLRRLFKGSKTGHCGTLDPEATGVLLIAVGKATRLFPYLSGSEKSYSASIRMGFSTDTFDASGRASAPDCRNYPPEAAVLEAMCRFEGAITQRIPPFSAKKTGGKPMYRLARAQKAVPPRTQKVFVRRFTLRAYRPPLAEVEVECSAGTYVRSLAHELGQILGCGAHLAGLRRTASGEYRLSDCHSLDEIEIWGRDGFWEKFLIPMEDLLPGIPSLTLTAEGRVRARHGNRIMPGQILGQFPSEEAPRLGPDAVFRLLSDDGKLLALAGHSPEKNALLPFLVFMD